jgi:outer membrane lipoprotein SlyB
MGALVATSFASVSVPAEAHKSKYRHTHTTQYAGSTYARRCRTSQGNAGLLAGGVGGAVVGSKALGGGILGTAAGAVGGALAGRAIDRTLTARERCRY